MTTVMSPGNQEEDKKDTKGGKANEWGASMAIS